MSYVDALSSDEEDEFPPGYLTADLTKEEELSDDEENRGAFGDKHDAPVRVDGPPVEFKAVSYRERKFANKMRKRVDARVYHKPPSVQKGPARSGYTNLSLAITTKTTVVDLSGQKLPDESLASLWTLLGESPVLRRVNLRRIGFWSGHAEGLREALLCNPGSLEGVDLMGNELDDAGLKVLFQFDPWRTLCKGKLRFLDLRSNTLSADAGSILAAAALPPPPPPPPDSGDDDDASSLGTGVSGAEASSSASPLPWANPSASYLGGGSTGGVSNEHEKQSAKQLVPKASSSAESVESLVEQRASRFDELSGVPTESLLRTDSSSSSPSSSVEGREDSEMLRALNLSSCGLGAAEASLVGELFKRGAGPWVTSLDLSWNSAVGCDGVGAMAKALQASSCCCPLQSLDLSGTRCCDVDERGDPFLVNQACYGGSLLREPGSLLKRREPVMVPSHFRSEGVAELALVLRARDTVVARCLKRLALNDCCLCPKFDERKVKTARPEEWCRPPDPYDKKFLHEGQVVRCRVLLPGVGKHRFRKEWHNGKAAEVKASKASPNGGYITVGVLWDEEGMEKQTLIAAQRIFNAKEAEKTAALKAKYEADKAAGKKVTKPPRGMVSSRPKAARIDADSGDVLTLQNNAAVAALAEALRHGVPPPPTPDELFQAQQEANALAKQEREEAERKAAEEAAALEKAMGRKKRRGGSNKQGDGGDDDSSSSTTSSPSGTGSLDTTRLPPPASSLRKVDSVATGASSWHMSQSSTSQDQDDSHVGAAGKATVVPVSSDDELAAFEREASAALHSYDMKQGPMVNSQGGGGGGDDHLELGSSFGGGGAAASASQSLQGSLSVSEGHDDDATQKAETVSLGGDSQEEDRSVTTAKWGVIPIPDWAIPTGGRFGGMKVGLQRLELQRCSLDTLGAETLVRGLEHPTCPLSALYLNGNNFGHGDAGGLTLVSALDANRSLTFLSLTGCPLSALVRREWAGALNYNYKGRLASIAIDAVVVPSRPLRGGGPGGVSDHLGGLEALQLMHGAKTQPPHHPPPPSSSSSSVVVAAAGGLEEEEGEKGGRKKKKESSVRSRLTLAMDTAVAMEGSEDGAPSQKTTATTSPWRPHQFVRSTQVKVSDALLLSSALAKNRFVTCLDLHSCVLDEESLQVLMDALAVRARLRPPPPPRPADEDYDDGDDDADGFGGSGDDNEEAKLSSTAMTASFSSSSALVSSAAPLSPPSPSSSSSSSSTSSRASGGGALSPQVRFPPPAPRPPPPGAILSLSLAGVYLGAEGALILAGSIQDLNHLRHLSLARCDLTDRGVRSDPARLLVRALEDEDPPPPPPPPIEFKGREKKKGSSSEQEEEKAVAAAAAAGAAKGQKGSTKAQNLRSSSSPQPPPPAQAAAAAKAALSQGDESSGNESGTRIATVGKSPAFWKFEVVEAPKGVRPGPPLQFLDLSDNGLPSTLVWRAVQVMRRRHRTLKWLDLSGNMEFDHQEPELAVEPSLWAAHNKNYHELPTSNDSNNNNARHQRLQLTLPMRHTILFLGTGVDWVVETNPASNKGKQAGTGEDDEDDDDEEEEKKKKKRQAAAVVRPTAFTGKGRQREEGAGGKGIAQSVLGLQPSAMAKLEARASAHGAPSSFTPTGVQGVAMKVEQAERARPELFQEAKDALKSAAFREGRLQTIDDDLARAEKHLKLLLAKHSAMDRLEVLTELKAAEDFQRALEAEAKLVQRRQESEERKRMKDEDEEMNEVVQKEREEEARVRQLQVDAEVNARETPAMESSDYDAGDYIHEVGVVGDGPKERAHVRRCFHALAENRASPGDLGWESLPLLLDKCGLQGLDEQKCENIALIEFDPMYGRRPDRIKVSDAYGLYAVGKLAVVFDSVDADGSGEIQADELEGAMGTLGFDMPSSRCYELLRTIDTNNDGNVDLKEFVTFFRFIPMDVRMKAEATAAASKRGMEGVLNLKQKLGMVVNPDGAVARVTEGGQAEAMGIRNGCRIVECGGVAITSLAEIKSAMGACKAKGDTTLIIRFRDPRRAAQAAAELARLKADSSAMARKQAQEAAALQEAKAAKVEQERLALIEMNFELRRQAKAAAAKRKREMEEAREKSRLEVATKKKAFEDMIKQRRQEEEEAKERAVARAKAEEERAAAVLEEQAQRLEVEEQAQEEVVRMAMERSKLRVEAGLMSEHEAEEAANKVLARLNGLNRPTSEAAKAARAARDAAQAAAEAAAQGGAGAAAEPGRKRNMMGRKDADDASSSSSSSWSSTGHRRRGGRGGKRLRYVLAAVDEVVDPRLFQFAFALVSIHDSRRGDPRATNFFGGGSSARGKRPSAAAGTQKSAAEATKSVGKSGDGDIDEDGDDASHTDDGEEGSVRSDDDDDDGDDGAEHSKLASTSKRSSASSATLSRATEIRNMTCELRCLRMWAKAMAPKHQTRTASTNNKASGTAASSSRRSTRYAPTKASEIEKLATSGSGNLFQDVRGVLMQRMQRGDVATWFRSLLLRSQPKPLVSPEHKDGSYLVCDDLIGWIVRLESKAAPCDCEGCQEHTPAFPLNSPHFSLPDLGAAPLTKKGVRGRKGGKSKGR